VRVRILLVAAGLAAMTAFATFAVGLERSALWQVVRTCIVDYKLTGAPFPCLRVDLSGGDERGDVGLRPPLLHDMILGPTRKVVGAEDPLSRHMRRTTSEPHGARGPFSKAPAGVGRIGMKSDSSSIPPSFDTRASFTSTWAAFFRP
jgi:hypothetical protein